MTFAKLQEPSIWIISCGKVPRMLMVTVLKSLPDGTRVSALAPSMPRRLLK